MTTRQGHAHYPGLMGNGALGSARLIGVIVFLSKDFLSGLLFAAFGIWGVVLSYGWRMGTGSRMGPGYFPQMLSWGIIALGVILIVRSLMAGYKDRVEAGRVRPVLLILIAIVLFGILAERIGMVLSLLLMIGVGGAACMDSRWKEVVISAIVLTAFAVGVFKYGLELPIPVWPRWN
jgi:hypothetical protein